MMRFRLGVFIGVTNVISMIPIVEYGQVWLVHSLERMGTNLLLGWKIACPWKHVTFSRAAIRNYAMRTPSPFKHIFLTSSSLQFIELYSQLKAGDRNYSRQVSGTTSAYSQIRSSRSTAGRFFSSTSRSGAW